MADIKEVLSEFSQIEILGEVLRRDRIERASSPMGMHLVNALSTFGTKGQDEVRRANAARNNRDLTKKAAGNVRTWNPAEAPGKPTGLPVQEVIHSPMQPGKPQAQQVKAQPSASQPSEKRSVPVAGTEIAFNNLGVSAKEAGEAISSLSKAMKSEAGSAYAPLASATAADIPNRPTKVLDKFGIEQVRAYLKNAKIEVTEGTTDREMAALVIKNFKPA